MKTISDLKLSLRTTDKLALRGLTPNMKIRRIVTMTEQQFQERYMLSEVHVLDVKEGLEMVGRKFRNPSK